MTGAQTSPTAAETKPTAGHTPGPWNFGELRFGGRYRLVTCDGPGFICEVQAPLVSGEIDRDHLDANARLIAAAPDLLEALKATEALDDRDDCAECEGYGEPEECPLCFPRADDARLMRRAAIAKAEGR